MKWKEERREEKKRLIVLDCRMEHYGRKERHIHVVRVYVVCESKRTPVSGRMVSSPFSESECEQWERWQQCEQWTHIVRSCASARVASAVSKAPFGGSARRTRALWASHCDKRAHVTYSYVNWIACESPVSLGTSERCAVVQTKNNTYWISIQLLTTLYEHKETGLIRSTRSSAGESDYPFEVTAFALRNVPRERFRSFVQRFRAARAVSRFLEWAARVPASNQLRVRQKYWWIIG